MTPAASTRALPSAGWTCCTPAAEGTSIGLKTLGLWRQHEHSSLMVSFQYVPVPRSRAGNICLVSWRESDQIWFPSSCFCSPHPKPPSGGKVSAQLSGASHQPARVGDREDCHLPWNESLGLFPDRCSIPQQRRSAPSCQAPSRGDPAPSCQARRGRSDKMSTVSREAFP